MFTGCSEKLIEIIKKQNKELIKEYSCEEYYCKKWMNLYSFINELKRIFKTKIETWYLMHLINLINYN